MIDDTDMLPQRVHAGWPEVESYERQQRIGWRFNIGFSLAAILCLSLIGWAAIIGGAAELIHWMLP